MIRIVSKIWPVLVIFVLWLLFCFPYFGKGLIPFPSDYLVQFFPPWNASYGMPVKNNAMPDVITQIYPWKNMTIDSWKQGQLPLWNPFAFAGTPHAGNYQTAVFSPMNILFFILPFIDAWSIMILLQPLLAALGTYLFLRALDRSRAASLIGAIGFMFCGFMTTWMAYGTLGYAALMFPWILWSIAMSFKKKTFIGRITLPLFVAISFFSGHFQISLYVCTAAVLFIFFEGRQKRNWKEVIYSLLGLSIGVGLAAPQLLLTYHAYIASTRTDSFIRSEVIPWSYLITLFSPDFFGNPVTRNDWFGHYAEWASYIGIIPLILAVFAISRKLKGYVRFFAVLGCFSIFLAYSTPLNDLLYALKLPAISTSAASRIIILFSFSLAMLSAFGLDELVGAWKEKKWKPMYLFIAGWIIFLAVVWTTILIIKPFPSEALAISKRNFLLPTALTLLTLLCMSVGFIKKYKLYIFPVLFLLGLSMVDSYRYVSKWMPFEERKFLYPESTSIAFLRKNIDFNRVFGNIGGEVGNMYKLPLIEGYDAMYQARYGEFINASSNGIVAPAGRSVVSFDKYGRFNSDVLQLLAVRYIYQRKSDGRNVWAFPVWQYPAGDMVKRFEDEHYEVYEYTRAYPHAFLASSYEVRRDPQEIIDALFKKDFDKRNTLILEEEPSSKPSQGEGVAIIEKYEATRVVIQTNSTVQKLLFLSDVYDDGWTATIDGKKTKIYRADYDFRAVGVPAGTHTVEYRYHPKWFRL